MPFGKSKGYKKPVKAGKVSKPKKKAAMPCTMKSKSKSKY